MSSALDAALAYAARGWSVLPLQGTRNGRCTCGKGDCPSPGKHPRTEHGVKDASSDSATIRRWWTWCPDANVGIATGGESGVFVLDEDLRHGGDDTLADLEQRHGELPATVTALTGGGGRHLIFAYPGTPVPSRAGVAPGLDVRGAGGFFVAPPSVHMSGRVYAWAIGYSPNDLRPAPAPRWLLELVATSPQRPRPDGAPLVIAAGQRNHCLTRIAGALRRYGIGEATLRECLAAINRHHAQPPLGAAELANIAASVSRYAPGTSSEKSGKASHTRTIKVA